MDYAREFGMAGEEIAGGRLVGKIDAVEFEALATIELGQAGSLQFGVVIGIEIVDADHRFAAIEQAPGHVKSDKAGRAGDQNHQMPPIGGGA